jgi:hypothetical protein
LGGGHGVFVGVTSWYSHNLQTMQTLFRIICDYYSCCSLNL